MAIDYPRAMAAYKVAAEGGHAVCQYQVGVMYYHGRGVDVDYAQALPWIEKAAAQDNAEAVGQLGTMYCNGQGVTPSFRRAREYYERAIELGDSNAVEDMQAIQEVTSQRSNHSAGTTPPLRHHHSCAASRFPLARTQHTPLMDKRVEIHGTSRADMNGKRGVATDFHPMDFDDRTTWRYTVKLDGGDAFKLKLANVRAEGAGGGGGGGGAGAGGGGSRPGKAKGKGKKGRAGRK